MTIYIDVVFFENIIMNYIIIIATMIASKSKIIHWRIIIGSVIGAIYTVIAYVSNLTIYSNILAKIILSIIIVYISFNPQSIKQLWKKLVLFYLVSFIFGGVAFALIYVVKPQDIFIKNGLFLGMYPLKIVFISAIVALLLVFISFKMIKSKLTKKDMYCHIKIEINNKQIETTAMIDTGNLLKEPITNIPVVVVEYTLLYDILPKQILNNLEEILGGDFSKIPKDIEKEYITRLKLIPFSSLGKQNGMLLGIKANSIEIQSKKDGEEEKLKKNDVIVGIYNKSLTKNGQYRALIGMDIL